MGARKFSVQRPDDEHEEARFMYGAQHGCGTFQDSKDGNDAVLFPVGLFGASLPYGVPFEVMSTEPCGVCNTVLKAWFEWRGRTVVDLGASK